MWRQLLQKRVLLQSVSPTLAHSAYVLKQLLHVVLHTVGQHPETDVGVGAPQTVRRPRQWPGGCLYSAGIQRQSLDYATARYERVIRGMLLHVVSSCSMYILFLWVWLQVVFSVNVHANINQSLKIHSQNMSGHLQLGFFFFLFF